MEGLQYRTIALNGKQKDMILELIRVVLERCSSQNQFPNYLTKEQFLDIIQQIAIIIQISQFSSEESKLFVSHIFLQCFAHSSSIYITPLCEISSVTNMLAFIVTILVDYSTKEKNREIRITSMEAIGELFSKISRNFGAMILPGIITPLSKIITGLSIILL